MFKYIYAYFTQPKISVLAYFVTAVSVIAAVKGHTVLAENGIPSSIIPLAVFWVVLFTMPLTKVKD